jgi:hypothetical protein
MEDIEPVYSFEHLLEVQKFFVSGQTPTKKWLLNERKIIIQIKEHLHDLKNFRPEIQDSFFRNITFQADYLLNNLYEQITTSKSFDVYYYNILVHHLVSICERVIPIEQAEKQDDELKEMIDEFVI